MTTKQKNTSDCVTQRENTCLRESEYSRTSCTRVSLFFPNFMRINARKKRMKPEKKKIILLSFFFDCVSSFNIITVQQFSFIIRNYWLFVSSFFLIRFIPIMFSIIIENKLYTVCLCSFYSSFFFSFCFSLTILRYILSLDELCFFKKKKNDNLARYGFIFSNSNFNFEKNRKEDKTWLIRIGAITDFYYSFVCY